MQCHVRQATGDESVTVEDVTDEAIPHSLPAPSSQMPAGAPTGSGSADQMQQYAEMMRDPQFVAMTESMLGNMSQEQLDSVVSFRRSTHAVVGAWGLLLLYTIDTVDLCDVRI